jgi:molecular chaperone GrpE
MANIKEMLKMNKKKNAKENNKEMEDTVKTEEKPTVENESSEPAEDKDVKEESKEEEKEESKETDFEEKFLDMNDKFLRLHAEFDNYRKRTIKERIELSKYATEDVIKSFLPVMDDLERAVKLMENAETDPVQQGVVLIYQKFKNILTQKGVEEIKTSGEAFNTDFHEAITNIPAESEDKKGLVIDVIEKGYLLHGKVIRFAKVVVAN